MDSYRGIEYVITSVTIATLLFLKTTFAHPCPSVPTQPTESPSTTESTIHSFVLGEAGRAFTSFTIAFDRLQQERLQDFEYQHFRPKCTPEYYRLGNTYRLSLAEDQPEDLFETHVCNLQFYDSLVRWVIANEELYPGQDSMSIEFQTAYRHLLGVITQLESFMASRHYVNGTNLTPTDCVPTAPSPTDYVEFERYSRALVILADVREILMCVILDLSSATLSEYNESDNNTTTPATVVTGNHRHTPEVTL